MNEKPDIAKIKLQVENLLKNYCEQGRTTILIEKLEKLLTEDELKNYQDCIINDLTNDQKDEIIDLLEKLPEEAETEDSESEEILSEEEKLMIENINAIAQTS